jgi:hypothetical protein
LYRAIATVQENGPGLLGHGGSCPFTIAADEATQNILVALPTGDWVDAIAQNRILFFMHGPTAIGRTALSSIRRYAGYAKGVPGGPSQFPKTLASPVAFNNGQNISVTGIFVDAYGRVGADYTATIVSATP